MQRVLIFFHFEDKNGKRLFLGMLCAHLWDEKCDYISTVVSSITDTASLKHDKAKVNG